MGGCLAGDPDRRGRLNNFAVPWTQVPVFGAVIVANAIVARSLKIRPNRALSGVLYPFNWSPRTVDYRQSAVTARLAVVGVGTSLYAFGIGLIFPTLFRFRFFPITYRKGPSPHR